MTKKHLCAGYICAICINFKESLDFLPDIYYCIESERNQQGWFVYCNIVNKGVPKKKILFLELFFCTRAQNKNLY